MKQADKDAGTIAALMIRLKEQRLPRARKMLERVNQGETLTDRDIRLLTQVDKESRTGLAMLDRHPEYHKLVSRCLDLYTEIINKGVENEKSR